MTTTYTLLRSVRLSGSFNAQGELVIVAARDGTSVEVLEIKGRWIKIKVDKTVGWVPRTKLSEPAASAAAAPEDGPRSRHLTVQVRQPDAVVRARPAAGAAVVAPVAPGAALDVLDGGTDRKSVV